MIFVLAGAKPVSMRYDPALMSIGCPSMRWFLGLFLCRLVPVRRWLQTFILWLSDLLSVGLRQWNHLIELIPVLWKLNVSTFVKIHQFFRFLRWISLVEAATWVACWCCQPFVVEATSWFPEETNPLQTKFCVICRRSFSELQWLELSQTCLRWDRSRSIRFSCFCGGSLVLQSLRRFTVEIHQIFVFWGGSLVTERSRWMLSMVCHWSSVGADGSFHLELVCGIVDG